MKKLLSLCAVVMLFTFADNALAGGHRGMNGMGHFGHHGGMHNGGGYGGQQYAGGGYRGGRFRNNGGYGAGYNYGGGYYGNGGYGAGYNYGSDYGDVVVVGGDDMPEQIYVYRQAPVMPYTYRHHRNCCRCQQW